MAAVMESICLVTRLDARVENNNADTVKRINICFMPLLPCRVEITKRQKSIGQEFMLLNCIFGLHKQLRKVKFSSYKK